MVIVGIIDLPISLVVDTVVIPFEKKPPSPKKEETELDRADPNPAKQLPLPPTPIKNLPSSE